MKASFLALSPKSALKTTFCEPSGSLVRSLAICQCSLSSGRGSFWPGMKKLVLANEYFSRSPGFVGAMGAMSSKGWGASGSLSSNSLSVTVLMAAPLVVNSTRNLNLFSSSVLSTLRYSKPMTISLWSAWRVRSMEKSKAELLSLLLSVGFASTSSVSVFSPVLSALSVVRPARGIIRSVRQAESCLNRPESTTRNPHNATKATTNEIRTALVFIRQPQKASNRLNPFLESISRRPVCRLRSCPVPECHKSSGPLSCNRTPAEQNEPRCSRYRHNWRGCPCPAAGPPNPR